MSDETPRRRSRFEAIEHLVEKEDEAEFEETEGLTDEQLAAGLREAGVDVDKLRARYEGIVGSEASAPAAPPAPTKDEPKPATNVVSLSTAREKRKPLPVWLLVAATVGAIAALSGGGYLAFHSPEPQQPGPPPVPSGPPQPPPEMLAAIKLRADAKAEYLRHQWGGCIDKLDQAAKLDPTGAQTKEYVDLYAAAFANLHPDAGTDAAGFVKPPL